MKLTPKQQKFAELYVQLGNGSEAYRQAYDVAETTTAKVCSVRAAELKKKLIHYIEQIQSTGKIVYKSQPKRKDGYIYIMDIKGFHYYKIGLSICSRSRTKAMNTIVPFDIRLVKEFYFKDVKIAESEIHEKLKDYRHKGEWFTAPICHIMKTIEDERSFDSEARTVRKPSSAIRQQLGSVQTSLWTP